MPVHGGDLGNRSNNRGGFKDFHHGEPVAFVLNLSKDSRSLSLQSGSDAAHHQTFNTLAYLHS